MKFKDRKRAGIIYSVKNKVTGEFYVGITADSIEKRKKDHKQKANSGHGHRFQEAISTHGVDAFSWKEIDTAESIDELAQKEKQYVLKYNSKEEGYNSDEGGGIKKSVYQYNIEDGSLINIFDCLEDAANVVSGIKQQISRACLSINKSFGGYYWSYEYKEPFKPEIDCRRKEVLQIDLEGNLKDVYTSVAEASYKTGVNTSSIAKVCRGERKTAGGYVWQY